MSSEDFAAAQQRLLARRQQRAAQQREEQRARRNPAVGGRVAKLPGPLRQLGERGLSLWDVVQGRDGTKPAYRVGQLDAELLDEELLGLLKGQVNDGLKFFGNHLSLDWSAEIALALRAILFKLSVWDHDASYGASLQGLKYTDARRRGAVPAPPTRWQKGIYGMVTVFGRYGWSRFEDWMVDNQGDEVPSARLLSKAASTATRLYDFAAVASFLTFLVNGRYRTILDRVLRMRLVPPSTQLSREVSFEYLNRQLVWHAFTEFLLFLLPLIGINRWRRWLARAWKKTKDFLLSGPEEEDVHKGEFAFLPERTCPICYREQNTSTEAEVLGSGAAGGIIGSASTDITNPYEAVPCGCVYCFVCIATKLEAEEGDGMSCLRCGVWIKQCRAWNGDVLVPARNGSGKHVKFADDDESTTSMEETERSNYYDGEGIAEELNGGIEGVKSFHEDDSI